jgi:filamentous hemagglutinin
MNANRHRIVFNRARGLLMAVAEIACAQGKSPANSNGMAAVAPPGFSFARLRPAAFAALFACGAQLALMHTASAQVVAYKAAPASQRPTVLTAGNGVPLVNIQTPSAAGVSRNTYEQFDVQSQGVILNNSRSNTSTQLGGWVQGNPWLARGSARVILNEVVSANPSQLLGYVEVAGSSAQVVIANPAGVTCNGCGFINASRATLTTGTPQVSGNLDSYRVEGGTIRIEGAGMDASRVGYTDLIARAVEVNAGIWAQNLAVTAGTNVVDAGNTQATPIAGTGAALAFAIDVASLGGMYAGKIVLVGTEAGVGVRNAGHIGASAGEVVVTADGRLTNSGSLLAAGNIGVDARAGISNTGTVYAQGDLGFATAGDITNNGGLVAAANSATLAATGATSQILGDATSVFAAGLNADGRLGAVGNLKLTASQQITTRGQQIAGGDLAIAARSLDLADTQNSGRHVSLTASAGDIDLSRASTVASGTLTAHATQTLIHESARTSAEGDTTLVAEDVRNQQGRIGTGGALAVEAGNKVDNRDGLLFAASTVNVTAASLDNRGGALQAAGNATVEAAGAIDNRRGLIRTGQVATLTATTIDNASTLGTDQGIEGLSVSVTARDIGNASGALRATANLTLSADRSIDNTGGLLSAGDTLAITDSSALGRSLAIANAGGMMVADKRIAIDAASMVGNGEILGLQDVDVTLTRDTVHSGSLVANRNMRFETTGTLDNSGLMEAGSALTVTAGTLNNAATGALKGNALLLTATDINTFTNRGLINGTDTRIDAITLNNLGTGRIYGDTVSIAATTLTNAAEAVNGITQAPVIAARSHLDLGVATLANRDGALIFSAGDLAIGGTLDGNRRATGSAATIENTSAGIESLRDLVIDATSLINQRHTLTITREVYQPQGSSSQYRYRCDNPPKCSYWTDITETTSQYLDELDTANSTPAATIRAGRHAALSVGNLVNRNSTIEAGGDLSLTGNTLTNEGAELYRRTDVVTSEHRWHYKNGLKDHGVFVYASSTSALADTVPAIISAGGLLTGSYTDRIDNIAIRQATAPTAAGSGTTVPVIAIGGAGSSAGRIGRIPVGSGQSVVSANPDLSVPANSLFHQTTDPATRYLIETDPAFANYRQWISSDYMLQQLALDPATTQKRLGDGFYEQRLITEQIAQLTGRRFLTGYQSDEVQYQALMNAGATFAKTWQLIPGIALSAEQMARLTSDIVWLVEKEVAGQKVLVPQVYARVQDGDLAPSSALLAGAAVNLETAGDLINSGRIAGRQVVALTAENIRNLGGSVAGKEISAAATTDLHLLGGSFTAENRLIATAGRDLTVESGTVDLAYQAPGVNGSVRRTDISRVAGLYVTGTDGTLLASAGSDLALLAAAIVNGNPTAAGPSGGTTLLAAGNNLTLGTVTETRDAATTSKKTRWSESASTEVGTRIQTAGDLTLAAGNDLSARAATAQAGGAINANAGRDFTIESGEASYASDYFRKSSSGGFLSKKSTTIHNTSESSTAIASTFSGDSVTLTANRDIAVKGSNVVATNDTTIAAGRNLTIEAATETHSETREKSTKQSGVFGSGGVGFTIGSKQQSTDQKTDATLAAKSTVGSTDGNVLLLAGEKFRQVGSDVIAVKGDIDIAANQVEIVEARETSKTTTETKSKQSGFTVAFTSPVISAVQTAQQMSDAAKDTSDPRMKALAAASTGLAGYNAYSAIQAGQGKTVTLADGTVKDNQIPVLNDKGEVADYRDTNVADKMGGVGINLSIGGSKSSSKSTQTSDTAAVSNLTAGRDIRVEASGAGEQSDILLQGTNATAARNLTLSAEDEIKLLAARNTSDQHSTNKNSSASLGIGFMVGGTQNGFTIQAGVSGGKGKTDGQDVSHSNTHVEAGQILTLESGGNTTLKGAVAKGEKVIADIGKDLLIESLQDTSTYDSKQKSLGVSVSLCIPPFCYGASSGSVSASNSRIESDYASVAEQSGIRAGDQGFDVKVKNDTDLKGGAITSTQQAIDDKLNRFETDGELTLSDIQNKAEYSAKSMSVNIGTSLSFDGALKPGGTSAGFGKDGDKAESMTLAAISGIAGNQNARTGDAETGIAKIFDADKVQKEINAQAQITQVFSQQAAQAVDNYAESRMSVLRARYAAETDPVKKQALQAEVDSLRLETHVMNVLIGAVTGNGASALTKESLSAGAEEMRQITFKNSTLFDGAIDESGGADKPFVLTNISGVSAGGKWDLVPFKGGGTRADLDNICGVDNSRCKTNDDGSLNLKDGMVQWDKEGAKGLILAQYLDSPEGQKAAGAAGGIQGWKGTLFGVPYATGSWQDKLVVAFEGTHDVLGGQVTGLYDAQGNTKRGMGEAERFIRDRVSEVALIPSAPFAAATLLPPEMWNAISIVLKAAK